MTRPNLLFVFADQMRGFDMACAGNPDVQTPHLDRFADEGMMFETALANCPVCTPSRAIMLTGLYPLTNRALANDLPLPEDIPTLGDLARRAGYRTGYVGKWHLDGVPRDKFTPPGPRRHGFEFWAAWNCSHQYFRARYYRDTPEPIAIAGYEPIRQTDLAIEFLQQDDPRPFCLLLSWGPPHDPYDQVPQKHRAMYDPRRIRLRGNVRELRTATPDRARHMGPAECLANYYAAITALDEQFGRLLDALKQRRLADDTIVVFTSDHGDMLFSQGMLKKQQPYEESLRIPFLIRWPGRVPAGSRPDVLLSTVDFAPSLLSLMGIQPERPMEGSDLSAVMLGKQPRGPASVLLMDMITVDEGLRQGLREWRGVRTQRYTYARWADGAPWLLYDNAADPLQRNNLVGECSAAAVRAALDAELNQWLERLGDRCLPWPDLIRRFGLVEMWNAREIELHQAEARLLES